MENAPSCSDIAADRDDMALILSAGRSHEQTRLFSDFLGERADDLTMYAPEPSLFANASPVVARAWLDGVPGADEDVAGPQHVVGREDRGVVRQEELEHTMQFSGVVADS